MTALLHIIAGLHMNAVLFHIILTPFVLATFEVIHQRIERHHHHHDPLH